MNPRHISVAVILALLCVSGIGAMIAAASHHAEAFKFCMWTFLGLVIFLACYWSIGQLLKIWVERSSVGQK